MSLMPGIKLGPYEIVSPLGAGGMGEVYRARDSKLGREVALKVLPEAFAQDAERMARFQREAQVLASLNHPNIAAIYGLEDSGGVRALVMELVEGETLAARLVGPGLAPALTGDTKRPPQGAALPLDEALGISKQIAEALEYAHERGIIHRDLKPANIKITPEGAVKVLDFGLAKALDPGASSPSALGTSPLQNSPTISAVATQAGMILGTAAYMSPEQAKGKSVDRRADIWAFGCVLYEMLTGRQAFEGETTSDVLAAVIRAEPDWSALPPAAPASIAQLLRRCLTKEPKQRLQAIGDARIAVEETLNGTVVGPGLAPALTGDVGRPPQGSALRLLPWAVAASLLVAALILAVRLWRATRPVERPLIRLSVDLAPEAVTGLSLTTAISPDGLRLAFPARGPDGKQQLATRLLDQEQVTLLPGTENGSDPFFSPDSQWIGFFADNQLKKTSVQGGAPVALCMVAGIPAGASWGEDGNIVSTMGTGQSSPLAKIPAAGGPEQALTKLAPGEYSHRWPQVLPGGGAVLFTVATSNVTQENDNIEAISLKTGQVKIVQRGGYYGRYLPSGHLVYIHQGVLFGAGFDPERLEVHGAPIPLLNDVAANPVTGGGQIDFSAAGTAIYVAGNRAAQAWQVAWLDSSGKMRPLIATPGHYSDPRLSPDGRKLAFAGDGPDVYIYDLERDTTRRLTFTGHSAVPVWAPDGRHLVFQSMGNRESFYWIRSDGAGEPQRLLESTHVMIPWSFSPDGRWLAYREKSSDSESDLWILPLDITDPEHPNPGNPEPFLRAPGNNIIPRFSPDGRWIAYQSDKSGSEEVYVRPFPARSAVKWQISAGGGGFPVWSNNGHELFYESDGAIMAVDYTVEGDKFLPARPRIWSAKQFFSAGSSNLDLSPDGKHFAVLSMPEALGGDKGSVRVILLLNLFDELKRRIPK